MKILRFQNTIFTAFQILIYLGVLGILFFTGIMLLKIIPYVNFGFSTNFLGTKTDAVLYKTHFRIAIYMHITSSLTLCVKIVLRKYFMDVHFVFAPKAQKQNERPKIFFGTRFWRKASKSECKFSGA
jgi:hypothetical protein